MSRSRVVLPCFLTILSLPPICFARPKSVSDPKGSLSGKVLLAGEDRPAWHARVEIKFAAEKRTTSALTNRKGEFNFAGLAFGTYVITANAPDCALVKKEVHLDSGSAPLLLRLQRNRNAGTVSVHELSVPEEALQDFNEGIRRLALDDFDGSISEFQRAIKQYPAYYEAYDKMGIAELEARREEDAERAFRKSIELSSGHYAEPLFALGVILCDGKKQFAEAEDLIRGAVELDPYDAAGEFALAWVLYSTGRLPEAEKSARQAVEDAPNSPVTYALLAEIHLRQRNRPALVEDVDAYLGLDPDGPFSGKARIARAEALRAMSQQTSGSVVATTNR